MFAANQIYWMIEELKYGDCYMSFMVFFSCRVFRIVGFSLGVWISWSRLFNFLNFLFNSLYLSTQKFLLKLAQAIARRRFWISSMYVSLLSQVGKERGSCLYKVLSRTLGTKFGLMLVPWFMRRKFANIVLVFFTYFFFFIFLSLKKDVNPH